MSAPVTLHGNTATDIELTSPTIPTAAPSGETTPTSGNASEENSANTETANAVVFHVPSEDGTGSPVLNGRSESPKLFANVVTDKVDHESSLSRLRSAEAAEAEKDGDEREDSLNKGSNIDLSHINDPTVRSLFNLSETGEDAPKMDSMITATPDQQKEFLKWFSKFQIPHFTGAGSKATPKFGWQKRQSTLTWHNLSFEREGIKRLQGVSGYIKPGTLTAVLGAPDSGVTTFFDCLHQRVSRVGKLTGEIKIDGVLIDNVSDYKRLVGYVQKDDYNIPVMTVRETLRFSSTLRNDQVVDAARHFQVEMIMKLLGLYNAADTIVGNDAMRGISGGEKRRLSFAQELVAAHNIILADLPTNGLDSANAYNLVDTLKKLGDSTGLAAMCSLVQPAPEMLDLFDNIMILSKGVCIYFGPVSGVDSYFTNLGFVRPHNKTVPDFLEDLSARPDLFFPSVADEQHMHKLNTNKAIVHPTTHAVGGTGTMDQGLTQEEYQRERVWAHTAAAYLDSSVLKNVENSVSQLNASTSAAKAAARPRAGSRYGASWFTQLYECSKRELVLTIRTPDLLIAGIMQSIIMGLIIGSLFWNIGFSQNDARTRFGLFFFVLLNLAFRAQPLIPLTMQMRSIYYKQKNANYFHGSSWYLSYSSVLIPVALLDIFIFLVIVYPMTGLHGGVGSPEFGYFFVTNVMCSLAGRVMILFLCSLGSNEQVVQAISPIWLLTQIIFCGFLAPKASIPRGWSWIYYLSFVTWPIRGLAINELTGTSFTCGPGEAVPKPGSALYQQSNGIQVCSYNSGEDVLGLYDMVDTDGTSKWMYVLYTFLFYAGYSILGCAGLLFVDWTPADSSELPIFGSKKKKIPGHDSAEHSENGKPLLADGNANDGKQMVVIADGKAAVATVYGNGAAEADGNGDMKVNIRHKLQAPPPVTLVFKDLSYSLDVVTKDVHTKKNVKERKQLLNSTYGYVEPGMLVALMGPSGAGKSTLLDVLAGQKTGGYITGDILINGKPKDHTYHQFAGYVEQFDSHNEKSTLREAIRFSARLRLPSTYTDAQVEERVDEVIDTLGFTHVQHQIIGSPEAGGISPELRKKVTIAVELVMRPSLLFLDEPTTGLEAAGALSVVNAIKGLTKTISCICTVHQPSAEIVAKFDTLLLMKAPGQVAYFGAMRQVPEYFHSLGLPAITEGQNIADYALHWLAQAHTMKGRDGEYIDLAAEFLRNQRYEAVQAKLTTLGNPETALSAAQLEVSATIMAERQHSGATFFTQVVELTKRTAISMWRDKQNLVARYFPFVFMGFMLGTLFFQMGHDQMQAANRIAILFMVIMLVLFTASLRLPAIFAFRPVYFRETKARMYGPGAYSVAQAAADFPFEVMDIVVFANILYWTSGMYSADGGSSFGYFFIITVALRVMAFGFAEWCGYVSKEGAGATAAQSLLLTLMCMFCGFLIPKGSIPNGWIWMYYFNFLTYPIHFLASNELSHVSFTCPNNEGATAVPLFNTTYNPNNCIAELSKNNPLCYGYDCPISHGQDVLRQFTINSDDMWTMFGIVFLFMFVWRFLSYWTLKKVNHVSR